MQKLNKDLARKLGLTDRQIALQHKEADAAGGRRAPAEDAAGGISMDPVENVAGRLTAELEAHDEIGWYKRMTALLGASIAMESMINHMVGEHTEEKRQTHLQKILRRLHSLQNALKEPS